MFTIQSVRRSVLQSAISDIVDAFFPDSMLRTALSEMPLRSAAVCCEMLSASLAALSDWPSVSSISAFVSYSITYPIGSIV